MIRIILVLIFATAFFTVEASRRSSDDDAEVLRDDAHRSYDSSSTGARNPSKASYWKSKPVKSSTYLYGSRVPPGGPAQPSLNNYAYYAIWRDFKNTHNKSYETTNEETSRFHIFVENHRKIQDHNADYEAGRGSFEMGMNQYGDLTSAEFRARVNGYKRALRDANPSSRGSTFLVPHNVLIPDDIDWRTKGYVTHVKDQGQCGSCWAFSAVGALEGQHFRKAGKMVELSEQNLVDCSTTFGNEGCNGGLMDNAFSYVKANQGIDTETSYPYEGKDGRCRFTKKDVGAEDTGFVDIPAGDESALEAALATVGPVSIAIDASHESFQFYKKGVYNEPDCSTSQLDHGVLAVGYGVDAKTKAKYYIVKNSWGTVWGQDGYILMSRRKDNQCGVASAASYPLV